MSSESGVVTEHFRYIAKRGGRGTLISRPRRRKADSSVVVVHSNRSDNVRIISATGDQN